jgi:2-dehydropantoate 2-reductase
MRFAVLGAGAIGAYVGAALSRGGADVTLIARGAQLAALQRDGVRVLSPRGDFHAHPAATDDIDAVGDADVVFVSLKAYSLGAIAPRLGAALQPGATTIWAQNGLPWWFFQSFPGPLADRTVESVDPGGAIARSIPSASVLGTVVYCATEVVEPGVIRHVEGTRFMLGEPDGSRSTRADEISGAFARGGLKAPVDARLRDQIWLKLLGNVAFNPLSALTGATLGQVGELPDVRELVLAIFRECKEIADRLGIEIPISLERRLEAGIAVGHHKTSMLQDLEAGKPLEHACMTGAIVELARWLEIPVPHTATIDACVRLLDLRSSGAG